MLEMESGRALFATAGNIHCCPTTSFKASKYTKYSFEYVVVFLPGRTQVARARRSWLSLLVLDAADRHGVPPLARVTVGCW